jgi:hypothetical protein
VAVVVVAIDQALVLMVEVAVVVQVVQVVLEPLEL